MISLKVTLNKLIGWSTEYKVRSGICWQIIMRTKINEFIIMYNIVLSIVLKKILMNDRYIPSTFVLQHTVRNH